MMSIFDRLMQSKYSLTASKVANVFAIFLKSCMHGKGLPTNITDTCSGSQLIWNCRLRTERFMNQLERIFTIADLSLSTLQQFKDKA
jgi:hypothetical protein